MSLTVALGLAALIEGRMATEWPYWRASYDELDATLLEGIGLRLVPRPSYSLSSWPGPEVRGMPGCVLS